MIETALEQPVLYGGAALALLLVTWLVWWGTRRLPPVGRWLARSMVVIAIALPAALVFLFPLHVTSPGIGHADKTAGVSERTAQPQQLPRARVESQGRVPDDREASGEAQFQRLPGTVPEGYAPRRPESGVGRADGATRSASGVAPANEDWDVVPVFYGTDRARSGEAGNRISYGAARAQRLELGRALVTVPKVHEVPNIERPWVYRLPFTSVVIYEEDEDPKKHFTLRRVEALTEERLLAMVRERLRTSASYKDHALVFVHGFNTSFDFAIYRTAQIAYDLKFDGAPFVYSWPSQGNVLSYPNDREGAQQAQPYLREFLRMVVEKSGAKVVSLVAHSMGSQLLMPVLKDLKQTLPEGVQLSQVIWAAPDMDRDGFANFVREIDGVSKGMTLYAHANDGALGISRKFWGGVARAGDVPNGGPLIIAGLDTIDVSALSTDIFDLNHSGFAERTELLEDIRRLIQLGTRPPEDRLFELKRVETAQGAYWRYQR